MGITLIPICFVQQNLVFCVCCSFRKIRVLNTYLSNIHRFIKTIMSVNNLHSRNLHMPETLLPTVSCSFLSGQQGIRIAYTYMSSYACMYMYIHIYIYKHSCVLSTVVKLIVVQAFTCSSRLNVPLAAVLSALVSFPRSNPFVTLLLPMVLTCVELLLTYLDRL